MYACPFHVLHDARDQDVFAVCYSIDFDLLALDILVYQNRMLCRKRYGFLQISLELYIVVYDLHSTSAYYI